MAKITDPQNIPPALLDLYRGTLNPHPTGNIVKKRYPYRMPRMQENGPGVHAGQVAQRARFKTAVQNFKGVSQADRARWYAAEPPYSSFLWYFNYFIMSSLVGNANVDQGGAGVIKSIQYVYKSIPTGGDEAIAITAVDPAKTVVMLFGNSYISDRVIRGSDTIADGGSNDHALSPVVDPAISEVKISGYGGINEAGEGGEGGGSWAQPYASALTAAKLTVAMINTSYTISVGYAWEVIEHKSQTIYPYVKSIAAEAITLSWPITPSKAAIIGAIVIEYI